MAAASAVGRWAEDSTVCLPAVAFEERPPEVDSTVAAVADSTVVAVVADSTAVVDIAKTLAL
jgi:hypothetical protein